MKMIIKQNVELTKVERDLLAAAYKNIVNQRQFAWKVIQEQKYKGREEGEEEAYQELKSKIRKELDKYCTEILSLIDDHIMPNCIK